MNPKKYTVTSSERTRKSSADMETKGLLYLMTSHKDNKNMDSYIVDFFNDLTAMDKLGIDLWDLQSKANQTNNAKGIGRELVTLYKNYLSNFDFKTYILFLASVPDTFRKDNSLNVFAIDNVVSKALKSLKDGLHEEALERTYIENSLITPISMEDFLKEVVFVVDTLAPHEYIEKIIGDYPNLTPSRDKLISIFNEIRDKQANKKNTNVEGITINIPDEALVFNRHIKAKEIQLVIFQRIIHEYPFAKNPPKAFDEISKKFPEGTVEDSIKECQQELAKALFNTALSEEYWALFNELYTIISENESFGIQDVYNKLDKNLAKKCYDFNSQSLKYLTALIKDGLSDDN